MTKRHVPAAALPNEDGDIGFYTAADLKKLGIAPHPSSILNLQRNHGFPAFVKVGRSSFLPRHEVHAWFEKRLRENRYPISQAAPKGARRRGVPHPPKSKRDTAE